MLESLSRRFSRRGFAECVLFAMIIAYAAVFSYFTILKYCAFRSYAWDLGIFNQSLWTTLNEGRLFRHTLELFLNPSGSFFAVHFQSDTLSRACTLCSASETRNTSRTTIRCPRNSGLSAIFVGEGRVQEFSFNCHDFRCRVSNLPSSAWR